MKKIISLLILVVLVIILLALAGLFKNDSGTNATSTATTTDGSVLAEGLEVLRPSRNQSIASPIVVEGRATGSWFFEATFPVDLVVNGQTVAQSFVTAEGDWMTTDMVPFSGSIAFSVEEATQAELIFRKANPSGLPENDMSANLPITLLPSDADMASVQVFFASGGGNDCSEVTSVEREIVPTQAVAQIALSELIGGPTPVEEGQGLTSVIPENTKVNSIRVENGVAFVDFDATLNTIAGSCAVTSARAQITQTLQQFPTVNDVVISVEGDVDTALQP